LENSSLKDQVNWYVGQGSFKMDELYSDG